MVTSSSSSEGKKETVLLIGARGYLGNQVLDALLANGKYNVQALIRNGSDASKIEAIKKGNVEPDIRRDRSAAHACISIILKSLYR